MQFDLISDFHIEFNDFHDENPAAPIIYDWAAQRRSPILVLSGDTSNSVKNTLVVLAEASPFYQAVLFVDGNHEHYQGHKDDQTVQQNMEALRAGTMNTNVFFLNGHSELRAEKTLFIGACGWYDFAFGDGDREYQHMIWKQKSNDPRCIRFAVYPDRMAREHADLLVAKVAAAQDDAEIEEIVVITHTSPVKRGLEVRTNYVWMALNGAYGNSQMDKVVQADTNQKIRVWTFGHTHNCKQFQIGHIRYVCNPRGYRRYGEKTGNPDLIQVDTLVQAGGSAFGEVEK